MSFSFYYTYLWSAGQGVGRDLACYRAFWEIEDGLLESVLSLQCGGKRLDPLNHLKILSNIEI